MVAIALGIDMSRTMTPRPENFAFLSFAVLWWLIVSDSVRAAGRFRWQLWIGVPVVMGLWANLHGSFLCGLAVLGGLAAGELISQLYRTRSLSATFSDPEVKAKLVAAELGLLATMVNPYGIDLLLSATLFAKNANLPDIVEWQPLVVGKPGGIEFFAGWGLAILLLRFSRRPVTLGMGLLLALFAVATLAGNRMVSWFALTYAVAFTPLADDVLSRLLGRPETSGEPLPEPDPNGALRLAAGHGPIHCLGCCSYGLRSRCRRLLSRWSAASPARRRVCWAG